MFLLDEVCALATKMKLGMPSATVRTMITKLFTDISTPCIAAHYIFFAQSDYTHYWSLQYLLEEIPPAFQGFVFQMASEIRAYKRLLIDCYGSVAGLNSGPGPARSNICVGRRRAHRLR